MTRRLESDIPYFVDVWQGHFQAWASLEEAMWALLSDDECRKADSFVSQRARQRYVLTRGILRQTLARYLGVAAERLHFEVGEFGKPYLPHEPLHFNLSHSDDQLLLAVANFDGIGIDLEAVKPRTHFNGLVERCFSRRESQYWQRLSSEQQLETFFRLWTKKEAFVKAVGRGVALGLAQCEFEPEVAGQLLDIPVEYGDASAWCVRELDVSPSMNAALVTPRHDYVFRQYRFEDVL